MSAAYPLPAIVNSQGRAIALGAILGKGGEGTVYEVKQTPSTAAKIYHKPLSPDRTEKIRVMAGMRTDELSKLTSWPVDLLRMKSTGQPIGLLMPKIADRKNVHHLYGPKSRLQDFPRADWRFIVRAAQNIASAFAAIHEADCVIGDVNHGSIMIAEDATASLIDCDSFQISTPTRKFLCEVGIETFTPPEIQGVPFKGVVRSANHDNFGLAVIIFHLLFMGRHPFAGRYGGAGDMPIAKAIKEGRFPYSANNKAMQMDRPPGTPALSLVGTEVAQLFEMAFSLSAITAGRPTARNWTVAMRQLEARTKQCNHNKSHWHPAHLSACPWCQMEAQGAKPLFNFVFPATPNTGAIDVETLWKQTQQLSSLGSAPTIAIPIARPSHAAQQAGRGNAMGTPIAWVVALGVFIGGSVLVPPLFWLMFLLAAGAYHFIQDHFSNAGEVQQFKKALSEAEANFNRANNDWNQRAGDAAFHLAKKKFEGIRAALNEIPAKRNSALDRLRHDQRKLQLNRFLEKFDIEDAKIEGIGPGRKRTLESYGIETAEDIIVSRLNAVPGFGPKMIGRLVKWRQSIEAKFVFNPANAIDPRDIVKVEQEIATLRTKTMAAARAAYDEAWQSHARAMLVRNNMRSQMNGLAAAVAQARADYQVVKG